MPLLTLVTIQKRTNLPRDAVQNTFVFDAPAGGGDFPPLDDVANALDAFYNATAVGAAARVSSYMAPSIKVATPNASLRFYNITGHLTGTAHGAPIEERDFIVGAPGSGSAFPEEIACVLSMHSSFGTDVEFAPGTRPRSRDRGRVFIGPLNINAADIETTTLNSRPSAALRTDLTMAAKQLKADLPTWSIWSRKAAALKPVTGVWVDNAWDSQRRRGVDSTARTAVEF